MAGPAAPAAQGGGASAPSGGPARRADPPRRDELRATPRRTEKRQVVELAFTLAEPGRVYLVARGPAPSCRLAAVQRLDGERGENTVVFSGRLGGEQLEPGTYVLVVSREPRVTDDARRTTVRVVSTREVEPAPERDERECERAAAAPSAPITLLLQRELGQKRADRTAEPAAPPQTSPAKPTLPPVAEESEAGVAGVQIPLPDVDGDGRADPVAAFALAAVVAALLLTLATLVVRFLRGSWNP